jgi:Calcium-binding EGF domain
MMNLSIATLSMAILSIATPSMMILSKATLSLTINFVALENRVSLWMVSRRHFDAFSPLPDKNECDAFQCDFKSTNCENEAGSYHCKCKEGFTPNLECRPTLDLGLSDGGISDDSIIVSGQVPILIKVFWS